MSENDGASSRFILTLIWVFLLVVFLIFPAFSTKRRRKIWRKRWKERRWDVEVEEEPEEDWFVIALARYRAALAAEEEANRRRSGNNSRNAAAGSNSQAASIAWKEEEEALLRLALTEDLLSGYTKTLSKEDFIEVIPACPAVTESVERDAPPNTVPDDDVEVGVPPVTTTDDDDDNNNEEDIDVIQKSDSVLEGAYRVQLPRPGVALESAALPSGCDDDGGNDVEEKNGTAFANEGDQATCSTCRSIPNGCAICMDPFYFSDRVCWSSNAVCPHAFHEKCIVNWLLVLGRRNRMRILGSVQSTERPEDEEDVDLTDYQMLCPCCRQEFVARTTTEQQQGSEDF